MRRFVLPDIIHGGSTYFTTGVGAEEKSEELKARESSGTCKSRVDQKGAREDRLCMPENRTCTNQSRRKLSPARQVRSPKTAPNVDKIALLLEQRKDQPRVPAKGKMSKGALEMHRRKNRSTSVPTQFESQNVSLSDIAFSMDFEDEVVEFTGWTLSLDAKGSKTH